VWRCPALKTYQPAGGLKGAIEPAQGDFRSLESAPVILRFDPPDMVTPLFAAWTRSGAQIS
jgi:hypothetical protein